VHDRIGRETRAACRRNDAGTPVAKAVPIGRHRYRRVDHQIIAADEIGNPREVDVQVEYHRSGLRTLVNHFESNAYLQSGPRACANEPRSFSQESTRCSTEVNNAVALQNVSRCLLLRVMRYAKLHS